VTSGCQSRLQCNAAMSIFVILCWYHVFPGQLRSAIWKDLLGVTTPTNQVMDLIHLYSYTIKRFIREPSVTNTKPSKLRRVIPEFLIFLTQRRFLFMEPRRVESHSPGFAGPHQSESTAINHPLRRFMHRDQSEYAPFLSKARS
jgi:hypothetical protein